MIEIRSGFRKAYTHACYQCSIVGIVQKWVLCYNPVETVTLIK